MRRRPSGPHCPGQDSSTPISPLTKCSVAEGEGEGFQAGARKTNADESVDSASTSATRADHCCRDSTEHCRAASSVSRLHRDGGIGLVSGSLPVSAVKTVSPRVRVRSRFHRSVSACAACVQAVKVLPSVPFGDPVHVACWDASPFEGGHTPSARTEDGSPYVTRIRRNSA